MNALAGEQNPTPMKGLAPQGPDLALLGWRPLPGAGALPVAGIGAVVYG